MDPRALWNLRPIQSVTLITHKYFGNLALGGKLGNQIFEYAALFSIAKKNGYEFGFAETQVETFRKSFLFKSAKILPDPYMNKIIEAMEEYTEQETPDMEVLSVQDNTAIEGFFQSEKYFEATREELQTELQYSPELRQLAERTLRQVRQEVASTPGFDENEIEIVSVHHRRGDFVACDFPCLPMEYYVNCFSKFDPKKTVFVLCSDEMQTAIEMFDPVLGENYMIVASPFSVEVGPEFYDVAPGKANLLNVWNPTIDMCLMSLCDHSIIANSSFSWWATWFYDRPDKKILAPPVWFKDTETKNLSLCRDKWDIVSY